MLKEADAVVGDLIVFKKPADSIDYRTVCVVHHIARYMICYPLDRLTERVQWDFCTNGWWGDYATYLVRPSTGALVLYRGKAYGITPYGVNEVRNYASPTAW